MNEATKFIFIAALEMYCKKEGYTIESSTDEAFRLYEHVYAKCLDKKYQTLS